MNKYMHAVVAVLTDILHILNNVENYLSTHIT